MTWCPELVGIMQEFRTLNDENLYCYRRFIRNKFI